MRLVAYTHLDYSAKHLPSLCHAGQVLTVNFSAITEKTFKRVHGKNASMSRVLKNMDRLLSIRNKRGRPQIVLSFVVYKYNYEEFVRIAAKTPTQFPEITLPAQATVPPMRLEDAPLPRANPSFWLVSVTFR